MTQLSPAEKEFERNNTVAEAPLNTEEQIAYKILVEEPDQATLEKRRRKHRLEDMDEFKTGEGALPAAEIENDKKTVMDLKKKPDQKHKTMIGELLEALVDQKLEAANWFGENCYITSTTEYDDRINNTDFVFEWAMEDDAGNQKIIRLAVDCTTAENQLVLRDKVAKIIKNFSLYNLTQIKYFKSSEFDTKKPLINLPKVIMMLDRRQVQDLCNLLSEIKKTDQAAKQASLTDKLSKNKKAALAKKLFSKHPLQLELLNDFKQQLEGQIADIGELLKNFSSIKAKTAVQDEATLNLFISNIQEAVNLLGRVIKEKENSPNSVTNRGVKTEPFRSRIASLLSELPQILRP